MDHQEMRKSLLNAIDVNQLLQEIQDVIDKPSHYNLIESTKLFRRCQSALEVLSRIAEDASRG
jgi:hypothetical protein